MDGAHFAIEDGLVVDLAHMVRRDSTLRELSNLPLGWQAWRTALGQPGRRRLEPNGG